MTVLVMAVGEIRYSELLLSEDGETSTSTRNVSIYNRNRVIVHDRMMINVIHMQVKLSR